MAEQAEIVEQPKIDYNPIWDDVKPEGYVEPAPKVEQQPPAVVDKPKEETPFDVNSFLKEHFGWENVDAAKNEYNELKKLKETPPEPPKPTYANEESERFANLVAEGKLDEANDILNQQKRLKTLSNVDVSDIKNAAEVLRTKMQFDNPDLLPDEVDFLMEERYNMPEKPKQTLDETDDEYNSRVSEWDKKVKAVEKKMTIEAKLAKPELAKKQKEIVLPEIPKVNAQPQQGLTQKELEAIAQRRQTFEQVLENDAKNFNGFNVTVKDKEVEIPISYTVTPEEQSALKTKLQNFDVVDYFNGRWFDKDGKPNVNKMMQDLTLLEQPERVMQKFANDAASKRLERHIAEQSNLDLSGKNGGRTTQTEHQQQAATRQKEMEDRVWDA